MNDDMSSNEVEQDPARTKRIAVQVLLVQAITLALLWLLQARYGT